MGTRETLLKSEILGLQLLRAWSVLCVLFAKAAGLEQEGRQPATCILVLVFWFQTCPMHRGGQAL